MRATCDAPRIVCPDAQREYDLCIGASCPFRAGIYPAEHCNLRRLTQSDFWGFRLRCPATGRAPDECPLREGPVTITAEYPEAKP